MSTTAPAALTATSEDRRGRRRLVWAVTLVALLVLAVASVAATNRAVASLESYVRDGGETTGPDVRIRPGNGPAVVATTEARILGRDCTLAGPVRAAADGSGAFVVTSGARHIRCRGGAISNGATLRWPADHQVRTESLAG